MKLKHFVFQKRIAGLCLSLACYAATSAQSTNKLEEQFNRYNQKVLQEKIYMHTDRNFYIAGDIIWFKLYDVDASFHEALDVSKLAYIEILNADNSPVLQSKVALEKGKGNGSLNLPVNFQTGNYKLRAYTNWMKNLGPDYFFEKKITVVNTRTKREAPAAARQTAPEVRLFPEGGNLVYGIASTIACKVSAPDGKGIEFEGTIVDEDNNTQASFRSLEYGMGRFDFKPLANHKYKAIIRTGKGTIEKELPSIYKEGYVMHVADGKQEVQVKVATNNTAEKETWLYFQPMKTIRN
jgi:hypothetical protein